MSKLSEIGYARDLHANVCYSKGGLAIGTTAANYTTANAVNYTINGVYYTKAALGAAGVALTAATGTSFHTQPVSSTIYYVVCLDSAGTPVVVQGDEAGRKNDNLTAAARGVQIPNVASTLTPIGAIKIVTNASTTFVPATTALNAAGLTVTYEDWAIPPAI